MNQAKPKEISKSKFLFRLHTFIFIHQEKLQKRFPFMLSLIKMVTKMTTYTIIIIVADWELRFFWLAKYEVLFSWYKWTFPQRLSEKFIFQQGHLKFFLAFRNFDVEKLNFQSGRHQWPTFPGHLEFKIVTK